MLWYALMRALMPFRESLSEVGKSGRARSQNMLIFAEYKLVT